MTRQTLTALALTFLFLSCSFAKDYVLEVGQNLLLPIHQSDPIKISNGKIISWQDQGLQLKIKAKQEGFCTIKAHDRIYNLQIVSQQNSHLFKNFVNLVQKMKGLKANFINNQIQISGQLYRWKDWQQLNQLALEKQHTYTLTAHVDSDVQLIAQKKLKPLLLQYSQLIPNFKFQPQPVVYRLEGNQNQEFDYALGLLGVPVKTYKAEQISKQIKLNLAFAEVSQSSSETLGLSWEGSFKAQLMSSFKDLSSLTTTLNQAVGKGSISVLSQNSLVCEVNHECEFTDGGELPIRTSGFTNSQVTWKSFGIRFKFLPKLLAGETIKLNLNYEASYPDAKMSINNIPGIRIKKLNTSIFTKNTQSIVVTGLTSKKSSHTKNGLAPFAHTPLLGRLLGANDQSHQNYKVILIVTPQLISSSR